MSEAMDDRRPMATAPMTLREFATVVGATLIGDPSLEIKGARAPGDAEEGDLTFVASARQRRELKTTRASAVLLSMDEAAEHAHELPCATLAHDDPHFALVEGLRVLFRREEPRPGVDEAANVSREATLGEGVTIEPFAVVRRATLGKNVRVRSFAYIDDDVFIGDGADVGVGAVVLNGSRVGARAILQPGVVVGADGFGYAPQGTSNVKVPQVGGVVIGDDVEIGANSCVDRGGLSDTRVERGTKVDNLVQVGHGVAIGEDAVVIAQVGIGGDTIVGDRALLAGQVGVAHHLEIGADARVGAQGGVTRSVPEKGAVSGYPAFAHGEWLRAMVRVRQLDAMAKRLEAAEEATEVLRQQVAALGGPSAEEGANENAKK